MINLDGIPNELKQYPQWVCWKLEYTDKEGNVLPKPTKLPYSPVTGRHAKVNDPSTWVSFDVAVVHAHNYSGIGFVLTESDPFVFIDLDDPEGDEKIYKQQRTVFERIDSYTELSPSGNGVHILVKGSVPTGRKRGKFEIYSNVRFMTVTGNRIHGRDIIERHAEANALWAHLGGPAAVTRSVDLDTPQTHNDDDIRTMALSASNGAKFQTLLDGRWEAHYTSQSEADFAFIDIISFYTQNRAQIRRIFSDSILGARNKQTTINGVDYISHMITRSFDNQLPPVDIDELRIKTDEALAVVPTEEQPEATAAELAAYLPNPVYRFPPGVMGEVAQFILDAAPRPVPEVALAAAMSFIGGIVGKTYNVSDTGLNQYVLLLANTGIGKEAGAAGISKLVHALTLKMPSIKTCIGPGQFASPQGLLRHISNESLCFVSLVGEFGLQMRQMSSDNANPNMIGLRRLLLDLYNKSGQHDVIGGSAYSDKANNTDSVKGPAVTVYGESTPSTFYAGLEESSIEDGLLPRFTLIEYNGPRLPRRKETNTVPSEGLLERLAALAANAAAMQQNNLVHGVQMTPETEAYFDAYEKECDRQINSSQAGVTRELWNRAALRAMKLAALVAVGINPYEPLIDIHCAQWSERIVTAGVQKMLARFESGDIGSSVGMFGGSVSETEQVSRVIEVVRDYFKLQPRNLKSYQIPETMFKDRVISYAYIQRRVACIGCFKRDRQGATAALKRTIQTMIDTDLLREVGRTEVQAKYLTRQRAFMVATASILAPPAAGKA